jgi:hypothetical protein
MKMRHSIILQIMIILLVAGPVLALDPSLVAWYQFDEGLGDMAYDSAHNHNGMIYGATRTAGKVGGALYFNGWDNFVEVADDQELNVTGDITIAAWVNFYEGGLMWDGSEKAIVTKCVENGAIANPYDFRTDIAIEPELTFVRANDFSHECAYSNQHISLNAWHHVAVTQTSGLTNFYVDGTLTGMWWGEPPLTSPPTGNNYSLLIGARWDGLFFNGLMDDVRIYNRALSGDEIRNIPEPCTLVLLGLGSLIASRLPKRHAGRQLNL